MARYNVYDGSKLVNFIEASFMFASAYCQSNGYTFKEAPLPEPVEPEPTTEERVTALESENAMLKAQVSAQSDQMDFYEDCIAEMAAVVYA